MFRSPNETVAKRDYYCTLVWIIANMRLTLLTTEQIFVCSNSIILSVIIISLQNIMFMLKIFQSGLKSINNAILLYMQPLPLLWWQLPLTGHVNKESILTVNQLQQFDLLENKSITLPLWTRVMPRYIRFPTTVDFGGIFGGVWLVVSCYFQLDNLFCCYWIDVWKGLKTLDAYRARCECHTVVKRSFNFEEYWGTRVKIVGVAFNAAWPIPLSMIFDRGLDEDYWGTSQSEKKCLLRRQHYSCPCCYTFFLFHHVE